MLRFGTPAVILQGAWRYRGSFSFSCSSRWHRSPRKGPYALRPVSQQSPQGCPRNSANISPVEHRSFSTLEGGMSVASLLHSSFLQAINAVMLRPVHVQNVLLYVFYNRRVFVVAPFFFGAGRNKNYVVSAVIGRKLSQ